MTFARSQSMDDLDNYEIMNVTETTPKTPQSAKITVRKLTRQYSKSFHDIDRAIDGENSFESGFYI